MPLTLQELEHELQKLLLRIDIHAKNEEEIKTLLKLCFPFVKAQWERSGVGFGNHALNIMNRIKKITDIE